MNYKQQSRNRWTRVKLLREGGKTFREIGKIMGFSYQRAHQIFTGRPIYKNLSSEEKKRRLRVTASGCGSSVIELFDGPTFEFLDYLRKNQVRQKSGDIN